MCRHELARAGMRSGWATIYALDIETNAAVIAAPPLAVASVTGGGGGGDSDFKGAGCPLEHRLRVDIVTVKGSGPANGTLTRTASG